MIGEPFTLVVNLHGSVFEEPLPLSSKMKKITTLPRGGVTGPAGACISETPVPTDQRQSHMLEEYLRFPN